MLLLFILGLTTGAWAAPQTTAKPPAKAKPPVISADLANRLQAYFSDSRKELGPMEPWQQRVFEEEAIPEYQRFIRDYRSTKAAGGAGAPTVEAEIDFESLKQFLRFYAPKSLKRESPSIVVVLKAQTGCAKCVASLPDEKKLVAARMERRGLRVIWPTPAELGEYSPDQFAEKRKAVGSLLVNCQMAAPEDIDSAHADENHYVIKSVFSIRDVSRNEAQLDMTENSDFERLAGKLLTDAFTDLGEKIEKLEITQTELKREEILVEISGIHGFSQYQAIKAMVQEALKSGASVEEQKVSRGKATLAVFTEMPVQSVQALLSKMTRTGTIRVGAVTVQDRNIHMEIPSQ